MNDAETRAELTDPALKASGLGVVDASLPLFDRIKGEKRLAMLENCGHFPVEEPGVSQLVEAVGEFLEQLPATSLNRF